MKAKLSLSILVVGAMFGCSHMNESKRFPSSIDDHQSYGVRELSLEMQSLYGVSVRTAAYKGATERDLEILIPATKECLSRFSNRYKIKKGSLIFGEVSLYNNDRDYAYDLYFNSTSERSEIAYSLSSRFLNDLDGVEKYTAGCVNYLEQGYPVEKLVITDDAAPIVKLKKEMKDEFGLTIEVDSSRQPSESGVNNVLAPATKECIEIFTARNNIEKKDLKFTHIQLRSEHSDDRFSLYVYDDPRYTSRLKIADHYEDNQLGKNLAVEQCVDYLEGRYPF